MRDIVKRARQMAKAAKASSHWTAARGDEVACLPATGSDPGCRWPSLPPQNFNRKLGNLFMHWQIFWVTFGTIFLAEIGDKTQLAALTLAAEQGTPWTVLAGACSALCLGTYLGVMLGGVGGPIYTPAVIKKAAGLASVAIGALILLGKW